MKTSKQWLNEVKTDSNKFNRWLSRQYKAEVEAAYRIAELCNNSEKKNKAILNKISEDEFKHADLLKEICNSRSIQIAVNDNSRYYSEFNLEALSLDELYAAGYFAEGMRLNRIKAIVQDSEMPQDIRNCFRIILKDEEMHEKAFAALSSDKAKNSVKTMHDRGVKALGLVI